MLRPAARKRSAYFGIGSPHEKHLVVLGCGSVAAWSSAPVSTQLRRPRLGQTAAMAAAATQVGLTFSSTGPSRNCARAAGRVLKVHMHLGVCLVDQLDRVQAPSQESQREDCRACSNAGV